MLTQNSTKADIQKMVLRIILKHENKFTAYDVFNQTVKKCDKSIDKDFVEEVVYKTLDYCWGEIHLFEKFDNAYVMIPERKAVFEEFLRHEGVVAQL